LVLQPAKPITAAEQSLAAADKKNVDLADRLDATNARLRATADTLGQNVGATRNRSTPELRSSSRRKVTERRDRQLAQQQQAADQKIGAAPATSQASRPMSAESRPTSPPRAATSTPPRPRCRA